LTDNLRHKLVACLRGLEADLRCSPTPTPVPAPDDRWGLSTAVGAALRDMPPLAKGDGRAVATVGLYRQAADGLANAEFVSMNQAAKWLQTERKKLWGDHAGSWAAFEKPVSDIWNDTWPMLKGDVIEFYRAVANGIEATL